MFDWLQPSSGILMAIFRHIREEGGEVMDVVGRWITHGYSESWLKESFTFSSLKEIMALVDNEEQGD
jgi:hypothetical protein